MHINSEATCRRSAGRMSVAFAVIASWAGASRRALRHCVRASATRFVLAPKLPALVAVSCAMAVAGCAPYATEHETRANFAQRAAPVHRYNTTPHQHPKRRAPRVDRALLAPQSAPACEYGKAELQTADPALWARLKLDYERECYRNAEINVRNRLRLLQTIVKKMRD